MQKILVVGPSWVGDMVMAQSLFMVLQQRYPELVIDVLAPAWSGPILQRMPEVRRHIEMPIGHGEFGFAARYRQGKELRVEQYDQAIVIPRSFKAALVPFFARIPRRTGYKGEMRYGLINDMRTLDKSILMQTVQRYVALGQDKDAALPPQSVPQPRLKIDGGAQQRLLSELSLSVEKPIVGFVPGAEYGPAKRWPVEHFAELANALFAQGKQVWLFGSAKDQEICQRIVELAGDRVVDLSGKTRLEDVVDLIALSEFVVTNDSGLMHVAAATDKKLITIYGSSSPTYTPPLTDKSEVIYLGLECSPCFERTCRYEHYKCLVDIKPDSILGILNGNP